MQPICLYSLVCTSQCWKKELSPQKVVDDNWQFNPNTCSEKPNHENICLIEIKKYFFIFIEIQLIQNKSKNYATELNVIWFMSYNTGDVIYLQIWQNICRLVYNLFLSRHFSWLIRWPMLQILLVVHRLLLSPPLRLSSQSSSLRAFRKINNQWNTEIRVNSISE